MIEWCAHFAAVVTKGKTVREHGDNHTVFTQGDPADSVYFITHGRVRLRVTSPEGKEAIVATLGAGELFGEGCLSGQPFRMATALSVGTCSLIRVEKSILVGMLRKRPEFSETLVAHLAARLTRYEADLVDQLFNPTEKRLARLLLLLSHFGENSKTETVVAGVNQEHLAQMVGTTRSRVNHFMNKFRTLGFIDYGLEEGLTVHRGLLELVQPD